jgi:hypothetical protein
MSAAGDAKPVRLGELLAALSLASDLGSARGPGRWLRPPVGACSTER